ncbi:ganglioside-induced differentiation-associated protein 1-like isoform X2 [Mya arenaria]|uniref:ganglioside-induced differentiation-associated protein 1-like isoform X2 n=1 Tax=Mya arenaria TaxID=6604 RepID=UPI0022E81277|nr:ganglioside-induced differentiation-associated protein 1-like isoform X2 [Mya arenaria]
MADVSLYYFPGSYYSLKAVLALYEKDVEFKDKYVNIHAGEQNEEWYLRINPNGMVPVLQIGDKYYSESEHIIDVVDHTFSSGPTLVPDVETGLGAEVKRFRELLDSVPVDVITFGLLANPQLRTTEMKMPAAFKKLTTPANIAKNFAASIEKYKKQLQTCPSDLKQNIEMKLQRITERRDKVMNTLKVQATLDDLESVFNQLADRLKKSAAECSEGEDVWLCGARFTAADITAAMLMFRLEMVGVLSRFASPSGRQEVLSYYTRLSARPTVKRTYALVEKSKSVYMMYAVKKYGKIALKIGLVVGLVGLGYLGVREYSRAYKGIKNA